MLKQLETTQEIQLRNGCFLMVRATSQCFALQWEKSEEFIISDLAKKSSSWIEWKLLGFGDVFDKALNDIVQYFGNHSKVALTFRKMQSGETTEIKFSPEEGRVRFAGKSKIRVLIVDDSKTIRKILNSILIADSHIEVVGAAELPSEAIKLIPQLRPDVITLDIHMPEMNGVELLQKYIPNFPIPTVMISSISREEGTFVFDALDSGAVDYIQKPTLENMSETSPLIIEKVKLASKAKIIYHGNLNNKSSGAGTGTAVVGGKAGKHSSSDSHHFHGGNVNGSGEGGRANPQASSALTRLIAGAKKEGSPSSSSGVSHHSHSFNGAALVNSLSVTEDLIVIGSSTGGTEALKEVLTRLPEKIPPILIVQHIPPLFSAALAQRLNSLCPFTVKEAEDGDVVTPGTAYIAPGAKQMKLVMQSKTNSMVLQINDDAPVNRHKPSVDYLFDSVAELSSKLARPGFGVILTGMGADGAKGLLRLKQLGWRTIAQNEETCVVYGMPKEAVKLGAAERVLGLGDIADNLVTWPADLKDCSKNNKKVS